LFLSKQGGYDSKATASVKSKTACLREAEPVARVSDILSAIGRVFLGTQVHDKHHGPLVTENGGYQMINPNEYWFPGEYYIIIPVFHESFAFLVLAF
jgi:hypothetical protein